LFYIQPFGDGFVCDIDYSHENADIVSSVVAVFEWLDSTLKDEEEFRSSRRRENGSFAANGSELLVANLARLQPSEDDDADDEVGKGQRGCAVTGGNLLEMDLATAEIMTKIRLLPQDQTVALKLAKETTLVSWLAASERGKQSSDPMLEIMAFLAPREEVHTVLPDWSRLPVYSSIFGRSRSKTRKKTKGSAKKEIDEVLKFYYRLSQLTEATD
jgi:hypothetical protein